MNAFRLLPLFLLCAGLLAAPVLAGDEPEPAARATDATAPDSTAAVGAAAPATGPLAVGAKITTRKPTRLSRLAGAPGKFAGRTVRLEGRVKAVCQGMGCWVEVEDGKGASFLARSLDETVLLPRDCVGRSIVVEGIVTKLTPKPQEGPAEEGHVCPRPTYVVATRGAMLR